MKTPQSQPQADQTHSAAQLVNLPRQAKQASPDAAALAHSPRMMTQRQAIRAAFGPVAAAAQLQVDSARPLLEESPASSPATQRVAAGEDAPNLTGMPHQLKSGIEALSGMDMSDVRVHRNSDKPAQLSALAYAQGTDIYLGPGQEKHLGHEAWHVVQQQQGRVQATMQMAGLGVNDDAGLEQEADRMGALAEGYAVQQKTSDIQPSAGGRPVTQRVVQRVMDWATNMAHNKRKVGVEITEDGAGGNRLEEQTPTGAWTALSAMAQAAVWTHTVNLPDDTAAGNVWQVAAAGPNAAYFQGAANKHKWMKWGVVNLTEDHGDIEWILDHPGQPQGVTEYRDRLQALSTARTTVRDALTATGLASPYLLSRSGSGLAGDVIKFSVGGGSNASSQITMESNDAANTKKALLEGASHGLDQDFNDPDRGVALRDADDELTGVVTTAANFKNWRRLFPKSHPSQLLLQSMSRLPTATDLTNITNQLNAQRAAIVADVEQLIANKLLAQRTRLEYSQGEWDASPAERDRLQNTTLTGAHIGGVAGVLADMGVSEFLCVRLVELAVVQAPARSAGRPW